MVKIDVKDKKILYELDVNSRQSLAEIGRKVKLPKTVVFNRIKSLVERGILKDNYVMLNYSKMGLIAFKTYYKFHSVTPAKEKEIIEYILKKRNLAWAGSCRSKWDITTTFVSKSIFEFDEIHKEIINDYGKYILEKDVVICTLSPFYSRTYLAPGKEKEEFWFIKDSPIVKIDETDEKIIALLSKDARTSILSLMQELKLTRDVISYRIKRLEKSGVIMTYRWLFDHEKVGFRFYKLIVRLHNFSKSEELRLLEYCKMNPYIVEYIRLFGAWDAEIEFEIDDEEKLYSYVNEIREKFDSIIRDYELLHIYQDHKINMFPD